MSNNEEKRTDAEKTEKKETTPKAPMSKTKKRLIAVIVMAVAVMLVLATVLIVVSVVGNAPPELEELRPRIEQLLDAAYDLNNVIWGEGLPTYPRVYLQDVHAVPITCECHAQYNDDPEHPICYYYYEIEDEKLGYVLAYRSAFNYIANEGDRFYTWADVESHGVISGEITEKYRFATRTKTPVEGKEQLWYSPDSGYYYYRLAGYSFEEGVYDDENDPEQNYDYVREDCGYLSVLEIKAKAEKIYSSAYRQVFYPAHFDGQTTPTGVVEGARYRDFDDPDDAESAGKLIKSTTYTPLDTSTRFLTDTMTMHEDSNATWVKVEIDYYKESDGSTGRTTLCFAYENGQWYIDCPAF